MYNTFKIVICNENNKAVDELNLAVLEGMKEFLESLDIYEGHPMTLCSLQKLSKGYKKFVLAHAATFNMHELKASVREEEKKIKSCVSLIKKDISMYAVLCSC